MNPTEIEFAVRDLVAKPYDAETFPYELIGIFNASKMTVSRIKSGTMNKAKQPGDVLWQKHLFFRPAAAGEDVGSVADSLVADPLTAKHKPRFILVTNGQQVHARDLNFNETENVEYERLDEQAYFLLPLAGYERRVIVEEHPADLKAAKKLKKLYDAILAVNPTWNAGHHSHELNLLMTRLLFCFYAEKTGIFETPKIFTTNISQTGEDGSEVAALLDRLFRVMNVEDAMRPPDSSATERRFPYVNGSLFEDTVEIPQFSRTARRQLLECGDLDWRTINPDIFGSMIQTIAHDGSRSDIGMHYTSVPNIMKVLQPLFLDELNETCEKIRDSVPKLEALLNRISNIRIFDPACGSGNFLIIAYKELRKLEMRVLERISELAPNNPLRISGILLDSFFGIDIVDFACETAKLSLWIAEYQMNSDFKELFGMSRPALPLAKISTVRCGNSLRIDWPALCPKREDTELYVCGNPPYAGTRHQTPEKRADIAEVFGSRVEGHRVLDYVCCWFIKLSDYIGISENVAGAFVATNSVCQGEQVAIFWPYIFSKEICIQFAHTSFKWTNSASHNAGVTCIIVGLRRSAATPRQLYTDSYKTVTPNINAYLVPSQNFIVARSPVPINGFPAAVKGSDATASEPLLLTPLERQRLLEEFPEASLFIRRFLGPHDFLYNGERYALWIRDEQLSAAESIPPIARRIQKTRQLRGTLGRNARRAASSPHRFVFSPNLDVAALIIPETTSEHRQYLQIGLLGALDIANNHIYSVYDAPQYLFALLSSRLHNIWAQTVSGKLEDRIRYSASLAYNNFPIPVLSKDQQRVLGEYSKTILKARARHPGKTLASLYNPDSMPANILEAHQQIDAYLEEYVYGRKFKDDTQRLEHLFSMYARMKTASRQKDTIFAAEAKAS